MAIHKLSPRRIATVGPGKYEDGGGLRLVASKTGAKRWILRFTIDGRRREMGLGSFPDVGLAEARDQATVYRKQANAGVDPIEARRTGTGNRRPPSPRARPATSGRIDAAWKNAKHARQWVSTLKTYARPVMGSKRVDTIGTDDILNVLTPMWTHQNRDRQALCVAASQTSSTMLPPTSTEIR